MYRRKYMSGDELSTANVVGILALFCCMSEFAILTPSIAAFSQHFAGTDITTIMFANSITGVVSVPVGIISGSALHKVGRGRWAWHHVPGGQRHHNRFFRR